MEEMNPILNAILQNDQAAYALNNARPAMTEADFRQCQRNLYGNAVTLFKYWGIEIEEESE